MEVTKWLKPSECGLRDAASIVPRLRRACLPASLVGFFHGAVQPHLDQMQHASINDPARNTRLLPSLLRVTPSAISEHCSELIGCPISRSLITCSVLGRGVRAPFLLRLDPGYRGGPDGFQ
jgi:hypothetical protein